MGLTWFCNFQLLRSINPKIWETYGWVAFNFLFCSISTAKAHNQTNRRLEGWKVRFLNWSNDSDLLMEKYFVLKLLMFYGSNILCTLLGFVEEKMVLEMNQKIEKLVWNWVRYLAINDWRRNCWQHFLLEFLLKVSFIKCFHSLNRLIFKQELSNWHL